MPHRSAMHRSLRLQRHGRAAPRTTVTERGGNTSSVGAPPVLRSPAIRHRGHRPAAPEHHRHRARYRAPDAQAVWVGRPAPPTPLKRRPPPYLESLLVCPSCRSCSSWSSPRRSGTCSLRGRVRDEYLRVVRAMRWWMVPRPWPVWPPAWPSGSGCLHGPAWMAWGWWSALGGQGNVYLGQTGNEGVFWSVTGWVIPVGLDVVVPLLARQEEVRFRCGTETFTLRRRWPAASCSGWSTCRGHPDRSRARSHRPRSVFAGMYRMSYRAPTVPIPVNAGPIELQRLHRHARGHRPAGLVERPDGRARHPQPSPRRL